MRILIHLGAITEAAALLEECLHASSDESIPRQHEILVINLDPRVAECVSPEARDIARNLADRLPGRMKQRVLSALGDE